VNEQLLELQEFCRVRMGTVVDLHSTLTSFTLDVIGRVGFGTRFRALNDANNQFVGAGKDILAAVTTLKVPWLNDTSAIQKKAAAGVKVFDDVIDSILKRKESELEDDDAKLNMLRSMQEAVDPQTGRSLSRKEIRDEIHTLLGAGHETTANTTSWALHLLANNPEVLMRVRQEIDSTPHKDRPGLFDFDQLSSLAATKRVVFETLRLFPTVPTFPRRAARDVELKGQNEKILFVPKGTLVFAAANQLLPEDLREPEAFRPERFDPESPHYDPAVDDKTKFMPFGGGGRICLGQRFAEMEAVQMLAALVSHYDFVPDSSRPPVEYCDITMGPKESGLWMRILARK